LTDKFNLYYVQSINDIIKSIGGENSNSNRTICYRKQGNYRKF